MFSKKIIINFIFSVVASYSMVTHAQGQPDSIKALVAHTVMQMMQKNNIPGAAVTVFVDGKPYSYYFGVADHGKKMSVTANTIFEVGSITSLMTTLLLAQQFDAGKVQLDQSITDYLTELPCTFEDMTLGNLATQTAGLPLNLPGNITSIEALNEFCTIWQPLYAADEKWLYSNVGSGLLGLALEKINHQTLERQYQTKILSPLGMSNFSFHVPHKYKKLVAQGYDQNGNSVKPQALGLLPAADGMKISAKDMQRFLAATIGLEGSGNSLFYPIRMTQAAYVQLADRKQGLGWEIHSLDNVTALLNEEVPAGASAIENLNDKPIFDGNSLMDQVGQTTGFSSYIAVIPNQKAGIVILVNRQVSNKIIVATARGILLNAVGIIAKVEPSQK